MTNAGQPHAPNSGPSNSGTPVSGSASNAGQSHSADDMHTLARWRLVIGKEAEQFGISCGGDRACNEVEEVVGFLFEDSDVMAGDIGVSGIGGPRRSKERHGGRGGSQITVPEWVDRVRELFPNDVKEVMERELVQRRGIHELLSKPELLEKIEPNVSLVKTLLTHKELLNPETRVLARKVIDKVVQQLKEKMKVAVEQAITGAIRKDRHSPRKVFKNLDLKTTIRRNLKNFDKDRNQILVDQLYFFAAERKKRPWHIIVTVDQSGSMLESAIFSAVMASIFYELPAVRTSLVLFDTNVVDMSDKVGQPVDVLMSVYLGGGTDITQGLQYSAQLAREPAKTIVVLITDFYEGRDERDLIQQTKAMASSGIRMIGLGALGYDARPEYNRTLARKLKKVGMDILVCTPEKLAECMAQIIRG
jgi:Mg-chelatase subunit ChlD